MPPVAIWLPGLFRMMLELPTKPPMLNEAVPAVTMGAVCVMLPPAMRMMLPVLDGASDPSKLIAVKSSASVKLLIVKLCRITLPVLASGDALRKPRSPVVPPDAPVMVTVGGVMDSGGGNSRFGAPARSTLAPVSLSMLMTTEPVVKMPVAAALSMIVEPVPP